MRRKRRFTTHTTGRPKSRSEKKVYTRLFFTLAAIGGFTVIVYFFGFTVLSNVDIFWRLLNPNKASSTILKDTTSPPPPYIQTAGTSTKDQLITISGFAEAGVTVKLFAQNDEVESNLANDSGEFVFENVELKEEGETIFYAVAIDTAKNESEDSNVVKITYDKTPPEITITKPEDLDFKSDTRYHAVAGAAEPDASVTVNERYAVVDEEGNFSINFKFEDGHNNIIVRVVDKAGNETEKTFTVKFEKED